VRQHDGLLHLTVNPLWFDTYPFTHPPVFPPVALKVRGSGFGIDGCLPCFSTKNPQYRSLTPFLEVFKMMMKRIALNLLTLTLLATLAGCAGMSPQGKSTAIGAGVGAGVGAVLTGGSPVGTVGGAAVGGVVGHEIKK